MMWYNYTYSDVIEYRKGGSDYEGRRYHADKSDNNKY